MAQPDGGTLDTRALRERWRMLSSWIPRPLDVLLKLHGATAMRGSENISCYLCAPQAAEECNSFCNVVQPMYVAFDVEEHESTAVYF